MKVYIKNFFGFILKIPAGIETSSRIPGINLPSNTDLSPYFSNHLSALVSFSGFSGS